MKCSSGINMPESRFNLKYITLLIGIASCTFVISLFLMQILFAIIFILWIIEKNSEKSKVFDLFTLAIILWGIIRIITVFSPNTPQKAIGFFIKKRYSMLPFFLCSSILINVERSDQYCN
jgi:hypothetical protein